jgi:GH25 family lysozyme M1 (1,4-beta-N-acetylmuramidase)
MDNFRQRRKMTDFKIVDMSEFNVVQNWDTFANSVDGIIMRSSIKFSEDKGFRSNYQNALSRRKRIGLYHFMQPDTPHDQQITTFLTIYNSLTFKPKFIGLDLEIVDYWYTEKDGSQTHVYIAPPSKYQFTIWTIGWLMEVEKSISVRPHIYTSQGYASLMLVPNGTIIPELDKYKNTKDEHYVVDWNYWKLWVASWGGTVPSMPAQWNSFDIWQNYVASSFTGIYGALDQDKFTGTIDQLDSIIPAPPSNSIDTSAVKIYWPTSFKWYITQYFGENPQYYKTFGLPGHEGIDIGTYLIGTPVLACNDGTIEEVSNDGSYGMHITIKHLVGNIVFHTLYAHLSGFKVSVGDVVKKWQEIGLSGNTGNSTGPHLHLSLMIDGAITNYPNGLVDPMPYLQNDAVVINPNPVPTPDPTPNPVYTQFKEVLGGVRLRSTPAILNNNIAGQLDLNPSIAPTLTLASPFQEITTNGYVFTKVELWVARKYNNTEYGKLI